MVIERVAVFFLKDSGSYSQNLERYGALYQSVDASTGAVTTHSTVLTDAPREKTLEFLEANWHDIYACRADMSLLDAPELQEAGR